MKTVDQLIEMKKKIKEAEDERNRLIGRKEQLLSQLKEEFDCASVDEAKEKLSQMEKTADKLDKEIEILVQTIGEKYECLQE